MANITERVNKKGEISYLIRVFAGEKSDGTQIIKSKTYKPKTSLTKKQIEKELNRISNEFEDKVKFGLTAYDGKIKFAEYSEIWLNNAQIAPKTRERYTELLKRVNQAIGHMKLQNIQAHHLEEFYKNLTEKGIKYNGRYAVSKTLEKIMINKKISRQKLAKKAGVSSSTVSTAALKNKISYVSAERITKALNMPINKVFDTVEITSGLSDKTISHHHMIISIILGKAKRERIIPYNVASEFATAPKVTKKEAVYLDDVQAQKMVELLLNEENIKLKTSLLILLYTGVRRGELCGLEWQDIDFNNQIIHIKRASQYQKGIGVVEVPTKNSSSIRAIRAPKFLFDVLSEYKKWWNTYKISIGSHWAAEKDKLFIQDEGKPINPDTINFWLEKFIKKNNLPHFTPHSLRHTFATLQIMAGVNIRTIQARTGHAQASTLVNIYSHAINTADEIASEVLNDILTPKNSREIQA